MPRTAKKAAHKKAGKARRTKEEVQAILDKVAALRAEGKSLTAALRDIKIPYNNYNYWIKRQGRQSAGKGKSAAPASGKRGAKAAKMQAVLDQIDQMRKAGQSLNDAVKSSKLTISNYYYWVRTLTKKSSGKSKAPRAAASAALGHGDDTVEILKQMGRNREERERLTRAVQMLDNDFRALLRKLESV
ncbi:MAG: hypothetical protein HZB26_11790 [Candidatus Hydrogenedentes bacterium]|nr:hypothetical protein [Candidatus Hydrogenedentota bacterium]